MKSKRRVQSSPPQQKSGDALSDSPFTKPKAKGVKRTSNTSFHDTEIGNIDLQRSKNLKPSLNLVTNKLTNSIQGDVETNNISEKLSPISGNNINGSKSKQTKTRSLRKKPAEESGTKFKMNTRSLDKSTSNRKDINKSVSNVSTKLEHWIKKDKIADLTTNSKNSRNSKHANSKTSFCKERVLHKMSGQIATKVKVKEKMKQTTVDEIFADQQRLSNYKAQGEEVQALRRRISPRNNKVEKRESPTLKTNGSQKSRKQIGKFKKRLIDEIVADQEKLSNYKAQVEEDQALRKRILPRRNKVEERESPPFEKDPHKKSERAVGSKFNISPKNMANLITNSKNGGNTKTSHLKEEAQSATKVVKKNVKQAKKTSTKTLKRINSASSDELPLFQEGLPRKKAKQTETFKKYGVTLPLIDEIIADQQQLSNYKVQLEEVQALRERIVEMPTSPKKNKIEKKRKLLDCKHLSLEDITRYFKDNIPFLYRIMAGEENSYRHQRYINKMSVQDRFTERDLTYNTSTIVFSFEQLDHMISLMREKFDPDDDKTSYFFKVLAPELCLKIFMRTHDMTKSEANTYLDNRPV